MAIFNYYLCNMLLKKALPAILFVVLAVTGCSKYQKVLKSPDMEKKYEAAVFYYEKKEFLKALPLLEELTAVLRGTARAEKTYYMYAYTQYYLGDYELAAYHFNFFTQLFPSSQYSEE